MVRLSESRRYLLFVIGRFIAQHGYSPTLRELCIETGVTSTNGVHEHLRWLKKNDFITWEPTRSRTIRVLKTADGAIVSSAALPSPAGAH